MVASFSWTLLLLAAALLASSGSSAAAQTEESWTLYELKPFAVSITSPLLSNEEDLPLAAIGYTLKEVTQKYLKEFFDVSVMHESSPLEKVQSVDLMINMQRSTGRRFLQEKETGTLKATMYGSAAFSSWQSTPARETAEDILKEWVKQAFSNPNVHIYLERLENSGQARLSDISSLQVSTDLEAPPEVVIANNNDTSSSAWSAWQYALLAVMFFLLFSFMACLVVYVRHDRKQAELQKQVYTTEDHHHHSHDLYGSHNLACMAERGQAQHHNDCPSDSSASVATSPLQLIYQAAFSGSQSAAQQAAQEQQQHYHDHHPSSPHFQDMLHDEHDVVDHHIHRSGPYTTTAEGGSLASWVRSLSSTFVPPTQYPEEGVEFMQGEKPVVYRDFPRHDGTPCLIYSPNDKDSATTVGTAGTTVWAARSSSLSPNSIELTDSLERAAAEDDDEPVDSFVDRLEQLMALRHEQYLDRCQMEQQNTATGRRISEVTPVITVEQAEAALEDFLDVDDDDDEEKMAPPVTPSPREGAATELLDPQNVLTDEKRIDDVFRRQQRRVSWDEDEDPTMTDAGVMT